MWVGYLQNDSIQIPKNPDPSLEVGLRVPIPSKKNRNVGVIPLLGHTWILKEYYIELKYIYIYMLLAIPPKKTHNTLYVLGAQCFL